MCLCSTVVVVVLRVGYRGGGTVVCACSTVVVVVGYRGGGTVGTVVVVLMQYRGGGRWGMRQTY